MPFGRAGTGEFGTYFIGYCRTPRVTEQMIENMFVGRPPGNYDRLLDFSRAVTGTLFFAPSATFLDSRERRGPSGRDARCGVNPRTGVIHHSGARRFPRNRLP